MITAAALVLTGFLLFSAKETPAQEAEAPTDQGQAGALVDEDLLVREDSPRLSEGDQAVFVEFLDFECEACVALYPVIEELRDEYGDQVSFVVRHMPLHGNSLNAALAAEAAAEQGEFEAMYKRLFETSEEWGHQQESQQETFFGFAEDLGLDMERFESDFEDPALLERVEQSQQDGVNVGVSGTPTFFLDGQRLEPSSTPDLENAIEDALDD